MPSPSTPTDFKHAASPAALPLPLVVLLAAAAGLSVAALYYSQPLLATLRDVLQADDTLTGLVPMLTQLGYALGILWLTPLGDRHNRRRIVLIKTAVLALALLVCALVSSIEGFLVASFFVGITATLAQDIVPAAAALARNEERGRVVGAVMTGLLLGILLSRVASGIVGQLWGFRTVYLASAVSICLLGVALFRGMPSIEPTTNVSYGALLKSLGTLWLRYPSLRASTIAQGLLAVAFSAFWSTLAIMLEDSYGMGSAVAGAFGLAGAAGALAAPLAGRFADRRGSRWVTTYGSLLVAVSFAVMALSSWVPARMAIPLLVLTTIAFDFAIQATLVGNQTRVYGLEPDARSRLNAILLSGMFIGMSMGALLGSQALSRYGWSGVMGIAVGASCISFLLLRRIR